MKTATTFLLVLVLALVPVASAGELLPDHDQGVRKIAKYTFNLTAAAGNLAIVIPANTSQRIYLVEGVVECSVACTYAQTFNGNISGGGTVDPVPLNRSSGGVNGPEVVYHNVAVALGSALPTWTTQAGIPMGVNLQHIMFSKTAGAQSYMISTGTITGTATIALIYIVK